MPLGDVVMPVKSVGVARKARDNAQQGIEPTPVNPPDPTASNGAIATPTAPASGGGTLTPEMQNNPVPNDYSTPPAETATLEETPTEELAARVSVPLQEYQAGSVIGAVAPIAAAIALSDSPVLPFADIPAAVLTAGALAAEILLLLGIFSASTSLPTDGPDTAIPQEPSEDQGVTAEQESRGYTDGSGYRTDPETGQRILDPQNLPANPDDLLEHGWVETTDPRTQQSPTYRGQRDFTDPTTGNRVRFDSEQSDASGFRARDHYHVYNPDLSTSRDYKYLDREGNPVRDGSPTSHILPGGNP